MRTVTLSYCFKDTSFPKELASLLIGHLYGQPPNPWKNFDRSLERLFVEYLLPFYMKTSRASVYPYQPFLPNYHSDSTGKEFPRPAADAKGLRCIYSRDHFFDLPERDTRTDRRRSEKIRKPDESAHGEQGVRQYHARDDTKLNPIHRMGWLDLPDSPSALPITKL